MNRSLYALALALTCGTLLAWPTSLSAQLGPPDGYEISRNAEPLAVPTLPTTVAAPGVGAWPASVARRFPARRDVLPRGADAGAPIWVQVGGGYVLGGGVAGETSGGGFAEASLTFALFEPLPGSNSGFGYELGVEVIGVLMPSSGATSVAMCQPSASTTTGAMLFRNALLVSAASLDFGVGVASLHAVRRECSGDFPSTEIDASKRGLAGAFTAGLELSPFMARTIALRAELFVLYKGGIAFIAGLFGLSVRL